MPGVSVVCVPELVSQCGAVLGDAQIWLDGYQLVALVVDTPKVTWRRRCAHVYANFLSDLIKARLAFRRGQCSCLLPLPLDHTF